MKATGMTVSSSLPEIERKSTLATRHNRQFGFLLCLLGAGLVVLHDFRSPESLLLVCGATIGVGMLAIFRPAVFRIPLLCWLVIGHMVGRTLSPIFLLSIYLFAVTPMSICLRGFGWDPLKLNPKTKSTWEPAQNVPYGLAYFEKQY